MRKVRRGSNKGKMGRPKGVKGQVFPDVVKLIKDERVLGDELSTAQEVLLRTLYGQPLTRHQQRVYHKATDYPRYSRREYREGCIICGRRSGKSSKIAANIAVIESCFKKHKLSPGERGYVVVVANTRRQAQVVFKYILARLQGSPALKQLVQGEPRNEEIDLTNGITIAVWPCSFRSIRGLSIVCAIGDEVAFWRDDKSNANPAEEVLNAIRPAMSTFETAKLILISSPYAKSGPIWEYYKTRAEHMDRLVWRLDSHTMNPSLSKRFLAAEKKRDPEYYAREYMAEFWESASALLPPEAIEACISRGSTFRPPTGDGIYTASLDAAFRGDNFAFSVVHAAPTGKIVQDVIKSWRGSRSSPVDLAHTVQDISSTLKAYQIPIIYGDSFCSEPVRQALAAHDIDFEQVTTLGSRAFGIWQTLRTLVVGADIELLDDPEQTQELKKLEIVITHGGQQRVGATSGHDDRAVALAVAAHKAVANPLYDPWVEVITPGKHVESERGWNTLT